jgi:hypothetical protein
LGGGRWGRERHEQQRKEKCSRLHAPTNVGQQKSLTPNFVKSLLSKVEIEEGGHPRHAHRFTVVLGAW